jgi:hypothetical protein
LSDVFRSFEQRNGFPCRFLHDSWSVTQSPQGPTRERDLPTREVLLLQCLDPDGGWAYDVHQIHSDEFDLIHLRNMTLAQRSEGIARSERVASVLRANHPAGPGDMQTSTDAENTTTENFTQGQCTIQRITYDEPVAEIDETHAASEAHRLQQMVQERIRSPPQEIEVGQVMKSNCDLAISKQNVYILRFGSPAGHSKITNYGLLFFRQILVQGPEMRPCRDNLSHAGESCELPDGALMFVKAEQAQGVRRALVGRKLCGYNVVFTECFEYLLSEVLGSFTFQERPKLKPGSKGRDLLDVPCIEVYQRTFLHWKPVLKAARSVNQSTTEVVAEDSQHHYSSSRGINVRRLHDCPSSCIE